MTLTSQTLQCILFLVTFPILLLGQSLPTYRAGEVYTASLGDRESFLYDPSSDRFLVLRRPLQLSGANEVLIITVDPQTLSPVHKEMREMSLPGSYMIDALLLEDGPYLVSGLFKKGERSVYLSKINPETAELQKDPILICTYKENDGKVSQHIHPESKSILHVIRKPVSGAAKKEAASLEIYHTQGQAEASKRINVQLPYTNKELDIFNDIEVHIDPMGQIYFIVTVEKPNESADQKKGKTHEVQEILKVNPANGQCQVIPLPLKGNRIDNYSLFNTQDGQTFLAGGYYDKNAERYNLTGLFALELESDGTIKNAYFHEIPDALIAQYERPNAGNHKDARDILELDKLHPYKLVATEDGGVVIHAESYIVNNLRYPPAYTYYDTYSMKINKDGTLGWVNKIPKYQMGYNGIGTMGTSSFYYAGKHYHFHIDLLANKELNLDNNPKAYGDASLLQSMVVYVSVIDDATGTIKRAPFIEMANNDTEHNFVYFAPRTTFQIAKDKLISRFSKDAGKEIMVEFKLSSE